VRIAVASNREFFRRRAVLATAAPRTSPSSILFQFDEKSQIVALDLERAGSDRLRHAVIRRNRSPNKISSQANIQMSF
jgi:hypothetical protein